MKKIFFSVLIFITFFFSSQVFASNKSSNSGWAAGIMIGEPTGLSIKYSNFPVLGIAWSIENHLHVHCDYYILTGNIIDSPSILYYIGAGGRVKAFSQNKPGKDEDSTADFRLGVRIPLGVQYFIIPQIDVFGEIVPGIDLYPATKPNLNAGIGIRYHFK